MCEEGRLKELMDLPISDILQYRDRADSVDPEDALRYLADMFIDNCGVSLGMRGFADYCSCYWIEKLYSKKDSALTQKYHGARTLWQFIPYISNRYDEGLDEYDSCEMSAIKLRDILVEELERVSDEKSKIILCAGICHNSLMYDESISWLDAYPMARIEAGIINFQDKSLIRYRHRKSICEYMSWKNHIAKSFTEEEIAHFIILNERLVELQHEVMDQVKVITENLQDQIAHGFSQYETFCVDGYIHIFDDGDDELFNILTDNAGYHVIITNDKKSQEYIEKDISSERHWYANWDGLFHRLEESHGLKFCRAFCHLLDESEIFTIDDIMKITPDMLYTHVEINI